jgi:hypothetical protein
MIRLSSVDPAPTAVRAQKESGGPPGGRYERGEERRGEERRGEPINEVNP